jgi:hypothetical protein
MKLKGVGAPNPDLQAYIRETFGMDLKRTNIATLMSQIKAEGRRRIKGPEAYTMEDLHLVRRIGASRLRDMVALFDR